MSVWRGYPNSGYYSRGNGGDDNKQNSQVEVKSVEFTTLSRVTRARERITVPQGIAARKNFSVSRTLTIEHSISINWSVAAGFEIGQSIKSLVETKIKSEISVGWGSAYRESDTVTVSVELEDVRGEQCAIVIEDVVQLGVVTLQKGDETKTVKFSVPKLSEIKVLPVR